MNPIHVTVAGALAALVTIVAISSALIWMLNPPKTHADVVARDAEKTLRQRLGTIIVIFSSDISSEHMMVLAARLARGQNSELLAAYIIEVPLMLPVDAVMEEEDRTALDTMASAEAIAKKHGVDVRTEIVHQRHMTEAVLALAKRERASLLIMGSYLEGKYTGAPLGSDIEEIAAKAKCDVLIGVEGKHGTVLESQVS